MGADWTETALFIHGIMLDQAPGPHDSAYDGLFDLIQKSLKKKGIQDKYLDLGDVFPQCHGKYWKSAELARYIAETF